MRALQKQYIVDVFVWIDGLVEQPVRPGQRPTLKDSELTHHPRLGRADRAPQNT